MARASFEVIYTIGEHTEFFQWANFFSGQFTIQLCQAPKQLDQPDTVNDYPNLYT